MTTPSVRSTMAMDSSAGAPSISITSADFEIGDIILFAISARATNSSVSLDTGASTFNPATLTDHGEFVMANSTNQHRLRWRVYSYEITSTSALMRASGEIGVAR